MALETHGKHRLIILETVGGSHADDAFMEKRGGAEITIYEGFESLGGVIEDSVYTTQVVKKVLNQGLVELGALW